MVNDWTNFGQKRKPVFRILQYYLDFIHCP